MRLKVILLLTASLMFLLSCSDISDTTKCPTGVDPFADYPYGSLRSHTGCKSISGKIQTEISDSDECITYQYFPDDEILYIAHKNTAFNCDPGKITAKVSIVDKTISIEEKQEKNGAKCNCLYDVDYDLRNIEEDIYLVSINGPIIDGVNIPSLSFYIDLKSSHYQTLCTPRGFYPWAE